LNPLAERLRLGGLFFPSGSITSGTGKKAQTWTFTATAIYQIDQTFVFAATDQQITIVGTMTSGTYTGDTITLVFRADGSYTLDITDPINNSDLFSLSGMARTDIDS
jgi:hypothetical protein